MNIALTGDIGDGGGHASANRLVTRELVRRGHAADHFDTRRPDDGSGVETRIPGLRWLACDVDVRERRLRALLPGPAQAIAWRLFYEWIDEPCYQRAGDAARARHAKAGYDALLFLGMPARFRLPNVPVVSWLQGPPHTEQEAVRRLKPVIVKLCGHGFYWKLLLAYHVKDLQRSHLRTASDRFVCPSEWSRRRLVGYGVPAERVHALPYPIDLELFKPDPAVPSAHPGGKTLLWLGRSVPRKRLDLMMDALALVFRERQNLRFMIVGDFAYAPGYRRLVQDFPFPDRVTCRPSIPRCEVPRLLNSVDVLVQPSENENFGSSVAEALACGVPAVVGSSNGTGEFGGQAGFHFERYTGGSVGSAIMEALTAVETRPDAVRDAARHAAETNFDVVPIVDRLERILVSSVAG